MLIAGDIGGTKTLLAFYTAERGARDPEIVREFPSDEFAGLGEVVRAFLSAVGKPVTAASFDVAGPVIDGRAQLTNLPWRVDAQALAHELGLTQVSVLNDLKAVAYAVPHLQAEDLRAINPGQAEPQGPIAIVAPGTGLGEAFLIWDGRKYIPCASEGGHSDFGPADPEQAALWQHLFGKFGHVAYERVCSGSAIPGIYEFLRAREPASEPASEPADFAAKLAAAHDRTPLIVEAALAEGEKNPLASATLDLFVSALGAEAGNLALKVLATGGVYLAGGMPARILPRLMGGRFMRAFTGKGRFSELLGAIPVKVVVTRAALMGAALYGLDALQSSGPRPG